MDFGLDLLTHNKYRDQSCHCWRDHTAAPAHNYFTSTFYYRTACSQARGRQLQCCHSLYERPITGMQGPTHTPACACPTMCWWKKGASSSPRLPSPCAPLMSAWQLLVDPFLMGKDKTVRAQTCTSSSHHLSSAGQVILNAAMVACLK